MTDQRKDEMYNLGDAVVERLKDAADRMLNGEIIGHNLSVFATDILTIITRADLIHKPCGTVGREARMKKDQFADECGECK
jgi:hypothetical protein